MNKKELIRVVEKTIYFNEIDPQDFIEHFYLQPSMIILDEEMIRDDMRAKFEKFAQLC